MANVVKQVLKQSTGLTGLKVAKFPIHELQVLYGKTLRVLQKMPESAAYRKHTEAVINHRFGVIKNTTEIPEIENQINCGQIEELIVQAENELNLSRKMLTWKPWEPLVKQPPPNQWTWPPTKA